MLSCGAAKMNLILQNTSKFEVEKKQKDNVVKIKNIISAALNKLVTKKLISLKEFVKLRRLLTSNWIYRMQTG